MASSKWLNHPTELLDEIRDLLGKIGCSTPFIAEAPGILLEVGCEDPAILSAASFGYVLPYSENAYQTVFNIYLHSVDRFVAKFYPV